MRDTIRDNDISARNGFLVLIMMLILAIVLFVALPAELAGIATVIMCVVMAPGFFILGPNEGKAFTFFGKLAGVWSKPGFYWCNIFYSGTKVNTKLVNFDTSTLKVNDQAGNPIEVTAIVVYHIEGIAKSVFAVERLDHFVANQAEAALRSLVSKYPYATNEKDASGQIKPSLLGSKEEVSEELRKELKERLDDAGVVVDEAHLNHLAYAPEIAKDMLKVQQAEAVIQAREKLVEGAVKIVEQTIKDLEAKEIKMLPDDKARLATNLLTVMASDTAATPVVPLNE